MNNYNDYYDYFNNQLNDMNYMTDMNNMIQDMNFADINNMGFNNMNDNNAFINTFIANNSQNQVVDPYQGFIRGNMFDKLYDKYKNYKPAELKPTSEREALLNQIQQLKFAMIDLGLYLDINPNDRAMLQLFNNYQKQEKQLCRNFEKKFGPLTMDSDELNANTWMWENGPWPWEVQK